MKGETRSNNPAVRSNSATARAPSGTPLVDSRGSEELILSRDREGAVVNSEARPTSARKAQVALHVQPRASRERVSGPVGAEWKLWVAAPPVEGKANAACVEFFARGLRVPKSAVRIVAGATGRHKRIEIEGVTQEALDGFLRKEAQ